jgi:hypothetical protein
MRMETRISTTIVPIEDYRKRFMSTAIDTYFNSSYKKYGIVFR